MYGTKGFSITFAVFVFALISTSVASKGYQDIDASGVKTLMEEEGALIVFPLSPMEFAHKHIEGSVNIIPTMMGSKLPADKFRPVVFYCLGVECVASWRAAEKAVELGHKNVYAFRKGLPAWEKAGYPVVTIEKLPDVEIKKITTNVLESYLANEDIILLDINLEEDSSKFYIDSNKRIHIPLDELDSNLQQLPLDKQIIIMCLKGQRSPTAARYLMGKGYQDVAIVEGGIQKWVLEGRPIKNKAISD